jgi:hypothetical protein
MASVELRSPNAPIGKLRGNCNPMVFDALSEKPMFETKLTGGSNEYLTFLCIAQASGKSHASIKPLCDLLEPSHQKFFLEKNLMEDSVGNFNISDLICNHLLRVVAQPQVTGKLTSEDESEPLFAKKLLPEIIQASCRLLNKANLEETKRNRSSVKVRSSSRTNPKS